MADSIKIGNLDISSFKVGSDDCKVYLGSTLLYPQSPTPPTPTYQWVSYNEGDAIPSENVYKSYGFRIPTQAVYDIAENGKYLEISFSSEEKGQGLHPVSIIVFAFPHKGGIFFAINGQSQRVSYDPEIDDYLEIIFSDYGVNYNYAIGYFAYGEEGDASQVYNFPFDMDLYEEHVPTLQWVTFNNGDTIPSDLDIYGVSGNAFDISSSFAYNSECFFTLDRNKIDVEFWCNGHICYSDNPLSVDTLEYIFSNLGCCDSYKIGGTASGGGIQLYIHA